MGTGMGRLPFRASYRLLGKHIIRAVRMEDSSHPRGGTDLRMEASGHQAQQKGRAEGGAIQAAKQVSRPGRLLVEEVKHLGRPHGLPPSAISSRTRRSSADLSLVGNIHPLSAGSSSSARIRENPEPSKALSNGAVLVRGVLHHHQLRPDAGAKAHRLRDAILGHAEVGGVAARLLGHLEGDRHLHLLVLLRGLRADALRGRGWRPKAIAPDPEQHKSAAGRVPREAARVAEAPGLHNSLSGQDFGTVREGDILNHPDLGLAIARAFPITESAAATAAAAPTKAGTHAPALAKATGSVASPLAGLLNHHKLLSSPLRLALALLTQVKVAPFGRLEPLAHDRAHPAAITNHTSMHHRLRARHQTGKAGQVTVDGCLGQGDSRPASRSSPSRTVGHNSKGFPNPRRVSSSLLQQLHNLAKMIHVNLPTARFAEEPHEFAERFGTLRKAVVTRKVGSQVCQVFLELFG
mmetsp:Transcript_19886/g.47378  ORF Transcript_19886/g.47378 Transcript_19886/m.47378 type:complete len:465 (+) Transcript_19886:55-1449(+)